MKTYYIYEDTCKLLIVGKALEIAAVFNSIVRACRKGSRTNLRPVFYDMPRVVDGRMYGIEIDIETGLFDIVSSDVVVSYMIRGIL